METTNRFAPPGAQVDDVGFATDGFQPIRLWPPSGRIGRLRFLAYSVGLYALFFVVLLVFGLVARSARGMSSYGLIAGYAVYLVGTVLLLIQRSHDMNLSGWWGIAAFVPFVGLLWVFKGGTHGANRWGSPPPPNGLAVKIIALFLPVLGIVGMIAAVALPAYQQYVMRAKAAATH